MSEEIKENGSTEVQNEVNINSFSWNKLLCWVALIMSITTPVASLGLSIITLSSVDNEQINETKVISYISIAISVFFILNDLVLSLFSL